MNGDNGVKTTRLRYVFFAFTMWIGLSIFFFFDVGAAVSVYFKFTAIYAAFWVLVGALLLYGRPMREKLLILGLFLALAACRRENFDSS